jgi:hypothetical protein
MRCVDRQAFLSLPAGTVYAKGVRWAFDGLRIKGETTGDDWWCLDPAWVSGSNSEEAIVLLDAMLDAGASFPMEDAEGRDGYFDQDEVFLVFERDDLSVLISLLQQAP